MTIPLHIDIAQYPVRSRWLMGAAWIAILGKCAGVWWAVEHWHMPFHPAWIVVPTLVFAGLASMLWATHVRD